MVARGFTQTHVMDKKETFSPMISYVYNSICIILLLIVNICKNMVFECASSHIKNYIQLFKFGSEI